MRHSYIPNYTPPYGTTKTVLLTLKERKAIGRRKLAIYVAERLSLTGATSFIKSKGLFYAFSFGHFDGKDDTFQVRINGCKPARIFTASNFDDMVDYLFTFTECELRRIEKIRIQRALDARSVQGTKNQSFLQEQTHRLSESLV
jgi:hypothetical protein